MEEQLVLCQKTDQGAELVVDLRGVAKIINVMIQDGFDIKADEAVALINAKFVPDKPYALCSFCGLKIGTNRCSRCATRYCSRGCQLLAWPSHREGCAGHCESSE